MAARKPTFNRVVNHVAISVPDIDAAQIWYANVLGFRHLQPQAYLTDRGNFPDSPIFKIYGDKLQKVKLCFMTTGNGVGIELFEFIDPPMKAPATSLDELYTRGGYFHICVTDPDPEALCRKACENGAKKVGDTAEMAGCEKALYMADPWGNVIEIMSCSWEQMMANRVV